MLRNSSKGVTNTCKGLYTSKSLSLYNLSQKKLKSYAAFAVPYKMQPEAAMYESQKFMQQVSRDNIFIAL